MVKVRSALEEIDDIPDILGRPADLVELIVAWHDLSKEWYANRAAGELPTLAVLIKRDGSTIDE